MHKTENPQEKKNRSMTAIADWRNLSLHEHVFMFSPRVVWWARSTRHSAVKCVLKTMLTTRFAKSTMCDWRSQLQETGTPDIYKHLVSAEEKKRLATVSWLIFLLCFTWTDRSRHLIKAVVLKQQFIIKILRK